MLGDQTQLPLSLLLDTGATLVPPPVRDGLYACLDCVLVTYVWKSTWRGLDSLPYLSTWYQRHSNKVPPSSQSANACTGGMALTSCV